MGCSYCRRLIRYNRLKQYCPWCHQDLKELQQFASEIQQRVHPFRSRSFNRIEGDEDENIPTSTNTATAPIKMLSLWFGNVPSWYLYFYKRMKASKLINWELVRPGTVKEFNDYVSAQLGTPCCKEQAYSFCDVRPMLYDIYPEKFSGYQWWGWCDLDIVLGDQDGILGEMLDDYDVISSEFYVINGGWTILRTRPDVTQIYKLGEWQEVLRDRNYRNYDEGGFNGKDPGGFTAAVRKSGVRCRFDERSWHDGRSMIDGKPSRYCRLDPVTGKLYETPTGRELLLYHLGSKRWPMSII